MISEAEMVSDSIDSVNTKVTLNFIIDTTVINVFKDTSIVNFNRSFLIELKEKLKECGFKSWITLFNQRLTRINTKLAQRGDLVTLKSKNSFCMGICIGRNCAFLGDDKLEFVSIDQIKYAWRWF